ncbi:uncharacterized protein MONBRDRAFT_31295 [Monosiga brevicollis MX1]|uniref:Smr domain-containing protein n=1 Tax=Monosiga brevicollis TaxID=81824 RepID=A9UR37_MONBE|nr:uncharacterized protein MONBRDRAFT_31295 [Monosiga brevicollis MX1]EDQ92180.1 predicted protein [Monosiga brevicollis MX1]|eukprot:XP_001743466.1 hypothetical protein [Monosiga brevicollis MX1]
MRALALRPWAKPIWPNPAVSQPARGGSFNLPMATRWLSNQRSQLGSQIKRQLQNNLNQSPQSQDGLLKRLRSALLTPIFARSHLRCRKCQTVLSDTSGFSFVRHQDHTGHNLGIVLAGPRALPARTVKQHDFALSDPSQWSRRKGAPALVCRQCRSTLGRLAPLAGTYAGPESLRSLLTARQVAIVTTSLISGNSHVLSTDKWSQLSAAEMYLTTIPVQQLRMHNNESSFSVEAQEFSNETTDQGTFRWHFVLPQADAKSELPTDKELGFFSQVHEEGATNPSGNNTFISQDATPQLSFKHAPQVAEELDEGSDPTTMHLSPATWSPLRALVLFSWDRVRASLEANASNLLAMLGGLSLLRNHAGVQCSLLRHADWHPDLGVERGMVALERLAEKDRLPPAADLAKLIREIALLQQPMRFEIDTPSLLQSLYPLVAKYSPADQRQHFHPLSGDIVACMRHADIGIRAAAEAMVAAGFGFNRRGWHRLCIGLADEQDIEALIEVAGLFEIDIGMSRLPVLSSALQREVSHARPFSLRARLDANMDKVVTLLCAQGARLKGAESRDSYRRCLLLIEAAKNTTGFDIQTRLNDSQDALVLFAKSGSEQQLLKVLSEYEATSNPLRFEVLRTIMSACVFYQDHRELVLAGLNFFDKFGLASIRHQSRFDDTQSNQLLTLALRMSSIVHDLSRAHSYIPLVRNDDPVVHLHYLDVLSRTGKVQTMLHHYRQHLQKHTSASVTTTAFSILIGGHAARGHIVDAVYLWYMSLSHRVAPDTMGFRMLLANLDPMKRADHALLGMALWRDACQHGGFQFQTAKVREGLLDLHLLSMPVARMAVLAFMEDLKLALYRYSHFRAGQPKPALLEEDWHSIRIIPDQHVNGPLFQKYTRLQPDAQPLGLALASQIYRRKPQLGLTNLFKDEDLTSLAQRPTRAWNVPGSSAAFDGVWRPSMLTPPGIYSQVVIVTGKGLNSAGAPVIRPMVQDLLTRRIFPVFQREIQRSSQGAVMLSPAMIEDWLARTTKDGSFANLSIAMPQTQRFSQRQPSTESTIIEGEEDDLDDMESEGNSASDDEMESDAFFDLEGNELITPAFKPPTPIGVGKDPLLELKRETAASAHSRSQPTEGSTHTAVQQEGAVRSERTTRRQRTPSSKASTTSGTTAKTLGLPSNKPSRSAPSIQSSEVAEQRSKANHKTRARSGKHHKS